MLLGVDVLLNGLRKRQLRSSAAFAFAGEVFAGQKLRSALVRISKGFVLPLAGGIFAGIDQYAVIA